MKHIYAVLGILGSIGLFYGGMAVAENSPGGGDIITPLIVFSMWAASVILLVITISAYLTIILGKKIGIVPSVIVVFIVIPTLYDYYKSLDKPPASATSASSELELVPIVLAEKLGGVPQGKSTEPVMSIEELRAELPEVVIPQGETIELLKIKKGSHSIGPSFYIRSVDGLMGYMSGTKICATKVWVNGLSKPCASFSQKDINVPVKLSDTTDSNIELIQRTYAHLSGVWHAEENYGKGEAMVLMFGDSAKDKQIFNKIRYRPQYKTVYPEYRLHITESADRIFFINKEWVKFHIKSIDSEHLEIIKPSSGSHRYSAIFSDSDKLMRYRRHK